MPEPNTTNSFQDFGRKVDETVQSAKPKIEAELQRLIRFMNDEVVPEVRRDGSQALRVAAEQMRKLAEYLESSRSAK